MLTCQGVNATEAIARRKRADGERSRAAILDAAARLATVEGLEGLSIGRLAAHIGMSKSGLYAHFGSKEELQLAAIDRAVEIFAAEVIEPARAAGRGLARLEAVVDSFASYLERRVFPGGCFFHAVTAEIDSHPGPVREKLAELQLGWLAGLERWIQVAQADGDIDPDEDAAQLAFELHGMMNMGNAVFVLQRDPQALQRARRGFHARLAAARN